MCAILTAFAIGALVILKIVPLILYALERLDRKREKEAKDRLMDLVVSELISRIVDEEKKKGGKSDANNSV